MSSIHPQHRASLCLFTFADGRRCRTPRTPSHPHFCYDHARKEARSQAADHLGKDLASFFSGDYLSACDLATALGRLIPAVLSGDIKPRTARTVAFLAQTLLQTIRLAQLEYTSAFSSDAWRKAIRKSVSSNFDHRFPSAPDPNTVPDNTVSDDPEPRLNPQTPPSAAGQACHPERSEGSRPAPTSPTANTTGSPVATQTAPTTEPSIAAPPTTPPSTPRRPDPPYRDHNITHYPNLLIDGKPL